MQSLSTRGRAAAARVLTVCAAAVAAVMASVVAPVSLADPAGASHIPRTCDNADVTQTDTLMTYPLTVKFTGVGTTGWDKLVYTLCVDSAPALPGAFYQEYKVSLQTGYPFYPTSQHQGIVYSASTASDGLGVTSHASASAVPTVTPVQPGTFRLSVPISICVGTSCPVSTTPGVAETGLLLGSFAVTPPPAGTTTGAGISFTSIALMANGTTVPLSGGSVVGAGYNQNAVAVTPGPTTNVPVCVPTRCTTVPIPALHVAHDGTAVARVAVGSSVYPVYIPLTADEYCVNMYC